MTSSELKEKSRTIDFSSRAHQGERNYQEDSCAFAKMDSGLLAVLSDGMGAHAAGDVASKLAVETFIESFLSSNVAEHFRFGAALALANAAISRSVERNPDQEGMGCTLVSVFIKNDELQWVSVGDSPLFLFRGGKIIRLNADHSMTPIIEKALKDGKITQNEADSHPNRHALRSALTGNELELVDLSDGPFRLIAGDLLIVASDGLLTLTESNIQSVLRSTHQMSCDEIAKKLINSVLDVRHPRQDNITVQIIKPIGGVSKRLSNLVPVLSVMLVLLLVTTFIFKDVIFKEFNSFASSIIGTSESITPKPQLIPDSSGRTTNGESKRDTRPKQTPSAIKPSHSNSPTPDSKNSTPVAEKNDSAGRVPEKPTTVVDPQTSILPPTKPTKQGSETNQVSNNKNINE